ncbi:MAG: autotransporter domain-containing protein, partial [Phascolarctobacterium sp.]
HVTTFKGGASAAAAGNIYQKDSNALTIDNYSGVTNIFYAHNGDGSTAENYTAGDTIIKHAEAGSVVNLITNGDGSAAADINVVANILSALAGKLTYANYVDGERNLTGTVKLAGGLTTDSVTWAVKDIVFDANSGQGGINKDAPIEFPEAPEDQEATDFNSGLNGSTNLEYVYGGVSQEDGSYKFTENTTVNVSQGAAVTADNEVKIDAQGQTLTLNVQPKDDGTAYGIMQTQAKDVNITAGTLEIKVLGGNGNEGIRLDNTDTENTANTNIKGNTYITLQGSASSKGITVNGNSQLNIQGDVTIRNNSSSTGEAAGALAVGIYAGGNDSGKSAIVNVDGATSLTGAGTGVAVIGSASEVNLNGAVNISTSFDNMVAVVASSGTANINMANDGPSNNTVKLNGNLMVTRDADKMGDTGYQSVINVNMDNASSSWTGVAYNQFDEATPVSLFALRRAVASTGAINLSLSNGAVWNNEALGIVPDEAATFTGSHITNLNGGTSYSSSGYIYQKDSNPLTIDNFSGSTILVYDHGDNDGTDVAHYAAGDTIINSAAEGSLVTLSTDSRNINVNDRDNVDAVMSALSQKLAYAAAGSENNLQGQVQISGGLTSDKIALWLGDLTFDAENGGLGQFTAGSSHRNYTTAESEFVQGTRTAIMSNMLSWRNVAASSYNLRNMRRGQEAKGGAGLVDMGSRLAGADEGTWARVYGGQTKYSGNNTSFDGDYWAAQVGYDKQLANGWTMGVAIDYQNGSDSYKTGSGDTKLYGLGFYGSKELATNSYLDLTARLGHVKNEFSASNETGKIDGDYSANGFSLSAQYSMRFGDDEKGYLEPQAQLTWARMGSSDFTAHGSLGSLHVNQDAMNSFVGRIGLEAGQASEHGNYFARISLAHEFAGDVDTSFVDSYGGTKATSYDLGGTWSELTVGGTFNLSKS